LLDRGHLGGIHDGRLGDCLFDFLVDAAEPSACALSATAPLLFEPLMGVTGSAVENPLILFDTEIS
jgi:hypothetical protein